MKKGLLLGLLAFTVACKKDANTDGNDNITLQDALNGKEWKITSLILTTSDGGYADLYAISFRSCEKDDLLKFNTDGSFTKIDQGSICNPPSNSVFTDLNGGSWVAQGTDSIVSMAKGFNAQVYKVTKWTANTMTWKQSSKDYLGIENTLTYTLAR